MGHKRIAKWDNLKALMISCVVIGHTIDYFKGTSDIGKSLYLFIYFFHMPVFVFAAGLLSGKTSKDLMVPRIIEYLTIYTVMKFLEVLATYIAGDELDFHFFWSSGPEWFALAMAAFLAITWLVSGYNKTVIFSLALMIGCLAGLDNHLGNHFASMRICVFYPIFFLGYCIKPEQLCFRADPEKSFLAGLTVFQKIMLKISAFGILLIFLGISFFRLDLLNPYINFLKGKTPYSKLELGLVGVPLRLLLYLVWIILIIAIIILVSEKEHLWTWLGTRTMSTFIWHKTVLVLLLNALGLKTLIKENLPHTYIIAAICLAMIVSILTAYLPSLRIAKHLKVC